MAHEQLRTFLQHLRCALNPEGESDLSDTQLLERFVNRRDEAAFEELVLRHGGMVLNVCGRLLRRAEDREDAFQATFLALTRRAGSIGKAASLGSWLYKVAYRVALRVRVRAVRHATGQENALVGLAVPSAVSEVGPDVRPVLDEEINRLPEKYRAALILCYLQGKTTAEAARQLGCARGTVCSRLAWARKHLRSRLTRRGLALSAAGLIVELAPNKTPAAMVGATVKAAVAYVWGPTSGGALSKSAIALAEGVSRAMMLTKLKMAFAGLLVVGVLGLGAGLGTKRVLAEKEEIDEKPTLARGSDGVRLPTDLHGKLGIQSAEVKPRGPARPRVLELPGSLAIDPKRLMSVRCRFAPAEVIEIGQIEEKGEKRELHAGDKVRKGQRLAVLRSLDVALKKSDLFDALVQLALDEVRLTDREKAYQLGALPEDALNQTRRDVAADRNAVNRARNTLLVWGIGEEEIEAVIKQAQEKPKRKANPENEKERKARLERWSRVELKAPSDGVIVERSVRQGEFVQDRTSNLFQIAQLDRLKVLAQVSEDDLPLLNALKPEQRRWTIRTRDDAAPVPGWIESVGHLIDPNQHTAVVTGFVENPEGRLRAGQFITASVTLPPPMGELVLPAGAVIEEGHHTFVFVQPDVKKLFYELRRVVLVRRGQDVVHIRSRLTSELERQGFQTVRIGERVVTAGAVELKAILEDLKVDRDR
jgi:cobalt-zinc-cadmium efflux system membrane fusion protein